MPGQKLTTEKQKKATIAEVKDLLKALKKGKYLKWKQTVLHKKVPSR